MNVGRARRTSASVALAGLLPALLVACTEGGTAANGETVTLRVADINAEATSSGKAWKAYAEAVESASDGSIDFEFNWSGSLLAPDEALSGMGAGVADMSIILPVYNPDDVPVSNWVAGLATTEVGFPAGMLQGAGAHADFVLGRDEIRDEFAEHNVELLTPAFANQFFDMVCTEPVSTADDLRGLKVRTPGEAWAAEAEALGMTAVPLAPTETFEGLQRGVVDCAIAQPAAYVGYGIWEVAPHYVPLPFLGWNAYYLTVNQDRWDGFTDEQRDALSESAHVWVSTYIEGQIATYAQLLDEGSREHGVTLVAPDQALVDQLRAFQAQQRDALTTSAPDSVEDPAAFIDDYTATMAEWEGLVQDELDVPAVPPGGATGEELTEALTTTYDLGGFDELLVSEVFSGDEQ